MAIQIATNQIKDDAISSAKLATNAVGTDARPAPDSAGEDHGQPREPQSPAGIQHRKPEV